MADMTSGNTVPDRYVVVIGGMNMDICGRPTSTVVDRDSNPHYGARRSLSLIHI